MVNDKRIIILFVKYPQQGRVKTRLARTVGDEAAVHIYRQLVDHLIRLLRGLDFDEICISFDPVEKQAEVEQWIRPMWREAGRDLRAGGLSDKKPALVFRAQCEGDLGQRLELAFAAVFEENQQTGGFGARVIAIGSDCIEIDGQTFQQSWAALETNDLVFGPTFDGGYYLIGMNALHPDLFKGIPWSSERTLQASLQVANNLALKEVLLDEKHDIDTEEDWRRAEVCLQD